jgi:magnesium-transporting ATPase (P-type)
MIDINGEIKRYKLLVLLEFTSARKRMTIIVKDEIGRIKVLTKGADSIIIERLKAGKEDPLLEVTNKFLEEYASEGLRTLLLAEKELS